MQHGIVEGDSVFSEPVRRVVRGVRRIFGRTSDKDQRPDSMFSPNATMDELPKFPERPAHIPPTDQSDQPGRSDPSGKPEDEGTTG